MSGEHWLVAPLAMSWWEHDRVVFPWVRAKPCELHWLQLRWAKIGLGLTCCGGGVMTHRSRCSAPIPSGSVLLRRVS